MSESFTKNRARQPPTFANINLLGPCNVDCYFCLGKDINNIFEQYNHVKTHFSKWENFRPFINKLHKLGIKNLYITGQNTDALIYKYLDELIDYLQGLYGFDVGIRTNGYLAGGKFKTINKCRRSVGYSIHSLDPETNWKIMRRRDIPDWKNILNSTIQSRVSIVLNRYNEKEFPSLLKFISNHKGVKYIQVRRICTDTRDKEFEEDIAVYENMFNRYSNTYDISRYFYGAECFNIYGKEVVFWRTVKTDIGSVNYYTDGTYTEDYFIIEGYLDNNEKQPIVPLVGYWRDK